jgi:hypothetical protein
MEIRIEISKDGSNVTVLAINACEDLLHDYDYFVQQAKKFDERKAKTIFMHKRYLRGALLTLFAYAEAIVNNWLYRSLGREGRVSEFEKEQWQSLEKKFELLDKAAIQNGHRARLKNAKRLRNLIVHLTPGRDAEFFDGLTLTTLKEAEQELKLWLRKMEPVLQIERHPKSAKVVHKLSRALGTVTADVSSKPKR